MAAPLTVLCLVLAATNVAVGTRTLKVTTILTEPFARYKSLTALPHELEGYIPDLLHEMEKVSDLTEIDLKLHATPVEDGHYGSLDDGAWNGMTKKLEDGTADLAAAPLTMNEDRKSVVNFLDPEFMTFDLAMLMRKSDHESSGIESIADLNKATKFKYTVVEGGSTKTYFRRSTYSMIWSKLQANEQLPVGIEEGVQQVRESTDDEPYIFISEQRMLEYHAGRRPCDLVVVKGNETRMEYRLAVKKHYDRNVVGRIEAALGKLNETGRLDALYNKWWIERSECNGNGNSDGKSSSSMTLASVTAILVSVLVAVLMQ